MAITVYTIEEYIEAERNGERVIKIGSSDPKLLEYVMNHADNINKESLASKHNFIKSNSNLYYKLSSTFNFGKHKGNELSYVYKCDPYYVEWCLLNASGFIIEPNIIDILNKESVFNVDDLFKYAKVIDDKTIELNLSSFSINYNNFPYSNGVREEEFTFSKEAIQANLNKSNSEVSTDEFFKGGNWGIKSFIQDKRLKKRTIVIKK